MPLISYIPKRYRSGFKKISTIEQPIFEAIQEGLSYTALVSSISVLSEKVSSFKKISITDVSEIFESAGSLTNLLDRAKSNEEIVDDISIIAINEKVIEEDSLTVFKERLLFFIANQQIYYAAKANALMTEYGNVFIQARVVTDIRPVFNTNVDDTPKAAIIIHNLHIHFKADIEGTHRDLYLALDTKDIKTLKEILIRAEQKENSLKVLYDKTGMTNLNE